MTSREEEYVQRDPDVDPDRADVGDQGESDVDFDRADVGDPGDRDVDLDRADVGDQRDPMAADDLSDAVAVGQPLPDGPGPALAGGSATTDDAALGDKALVEASAAEEYRSRWADIQASFVDQPRDAVTQADALVSEIIQRVADAFTHERGSLESQWSRGEEVSTEDLRQALQRYRAFFDRLLTT